MEKTPKELLPEDKNARANVTYQAEDVYKRQNVNIVMPQEASNRVLFAGEHLKKALEAAGYSSVMLSDTAGIDKDEVCICLLYTSIGQQLDKSVPVFGGVMGGKQCIIERILAAYIDVYKRQAIH